jgi:dihydrofolate synthase/folylpolyglutamate synthase
MIDFCERIRIGSRQIPRERLVALVEAIKPYVAREKELTTFEIMTSLAFQYFSQEKVDFAVIEVGMGGRLDATNVVSPVLSVITSI